MRLHLTEILLYSIITVTASFFPTSANADRCLVVYPEIATVYHYDVNEYFTVTPGDPLYDPLYDRGGEVLIGANDLKVAFDIYQAPNLVGFQPSTGGQEGYFSTGHRFRLIVDGFYGAPTTYENIILVFDPDPDQCVPVVKVNGVPVTGYTYPIGDLVVSTPTEDGNNFSDVVAFDIFWDNCSGLRIWAYADENYNGRLDSGECFTAFSHDFTVPAKETSWGAIKTKYDE
jgi:hypothetical protein